MSDRTALALTVWIVLALPNGSGATGLEQKTVSKVSRYASLISSECGSCHQSGALGAPIVTAASPHTDADGAGGSWAAGDCTGCHSGHAGVPGSVTIPLPPADWANAPGEAHVTGNMRIALGLNYGKHQGINLGGPGTAAPLQGKTTEAELCWSCHSALPSPVSEWGFNTNPHPFPATAIPSVEDGSARAPNFGWLYADGGFSTKISDWTAQGAWHKDGYLHPQLSRPIASIHTANLGSDPGGRSSSVAENVFQGKVRRGTVSERFDGDPSPPVLEDKGQIRCTYCHDVHDTFGPPGKPYLRGSWMTNPYPPDVPPLAGNTYPQNRLAPGQLDGAPRLLIAGPDSRRMGGYFIDANSSSPTADPAYNSVAKTAGLCVLCHGNNVDDMDYYTQSSLWVGANGHSNSVLDGTGAHRTGIFDARLAPGKFVDQRRAPVNDKSAPWHNQVSEYRPKGAKGIGSAEGERRQVENQAAWYNDSGIGSDRKAKKAHDFTCSKCHSPHASGLPALLITNCLDTSLATWKNSKADKPISPSIAQARNCHRKDSSSNGWNRLAPRQ